MSEAHDPARLMRFVLEMRQAGVTDAAALAALERTPRAHYAPPHLAALALDDVALPLPHGQTMTKPSVVGRMIAALGAGEEDAVLEIGTGSGFQAACLALRARRVVTVDRWRGLIVDAREKLGRARLMHVSVHLADGAEGYADYAPYERIIVNAAMPDVPLALRDQLAPGGVIVAPIGAGEQQTLVRMRNGVREDLGSIQFAPLAEGLGGD